MPLLQHSKVVLPVFKCRGFCLGICIFFSTWLSKKNAKAIEFVGIFKKNFPTIKNILIGPPTVAVRVLWIRVRPSIFPSFSLSTLLSGSFLGIGLLVFSETQHGVRGPCLVVRDRAGFFLKKSFCPKNGENGPKTGFFEFIGKFGH